MNVKKQLIIEFALKAKKDVDAEILDVAAMLKDNAAEAKKIVEKGYF